MGLNTVYNLSKIRNVRNISRHLVIGLYGTGITRCCRIERRCWRIYCGSLNAEIEVGLFPSPLRGEELKG
jgi:hypothetical protein